MRDTATWPRIHTERDALADDLSTLTDAQWRTQSLCAGWTVQDVAAHLVGTSVATPAGFFVGMAKAGFNFTKMTGQAITKYGTGAPSDTLEQLRANAHRTSAPPGPTASWLGEAIVHGEDIRRPLGIIRDYPVDAVQQVADFYKGSNLLIGAKKRIDGFTLTATDTGWTTGSGPVIEGPVLALLMAMTGRRAHLDDLTGDGLPQFRTRF